MKKIIIDTNIVFSTKRRLFQGSMTDLILQVCRATSIVSYQLVVPELVKAELVNLYREELSKREGSLIQSERRLRDMLPDDEMLPPSDPLDVEEVVRGYRDAFEKRLAEFNAKCPPYPQVSHGRVIQRCLDRRRPFRAGKGYRDTLIWETVLDESLTGDDVVFVTENSKDFLDEKGEMHADLRDDLMQLKAGSVQLCSSLTELIQTVLLPDYQGAMDQTHTAANQRDMDDLQEWVDEGGLADSWCGLVSAVEQSIWDLLETDENCISEEVGVPVMFTRLEDISLNLEDPDPSLEIQLGDENTAYALLNNSLPCEIEFLVERQHAHTLQASKFVTVKDWDWTDRLASASGIFEVFFSATFSIDRKGRSVLDLSVDQIHLEPWVPPAGS